MTFKIPTLGLPVRWQTPRIYGRIQTEMYSALGLGSFCMETFISSWAFLLGPELLQFCTWILQCNAWISRAQIKPVAEQEIQQERFAKKSSLPWRQRGGFSSPPPADIFWHVCNFFWLSLVDVCCNYCFQRPDLSWGYRWLIYTPIAFLVNSSAGRSMFKNSIIIGHYKVLSIFLLSLYKL